MHLRIWLFVLPQMYQNVTGVIAARCAGMRCVGVASQYTHEKDLEDLADVVCAEIGGSAFTIDDLTTPGTFWLNPPVPRDEFGNKYFIDDEQPRSMTENAAADAMHTSAEVPELSAEEIEEERLRNILIDMDPF